MRGKILRLTLTILLVITPCHFIFAKEKANPWLVAIGGTALVAGLSQFKESHIVFAAVESGMAFYMMNEWYTDDKASLAELITPFGLTTLALINLILLRDDDISRGDVFRANELGLGLIALNYYWSF